MPSASRQKPKPLPLSKLQQTLWATPYSKRYIAWSAARRTNPDSDLCLVDRFFLMTQVLHRLDADKHQWIYERCREVEREPNGYLDIWSREHYKSGLITFAGVIQEILRDPEITVGIFSHTGAIAADFLKQIKREFETNEDLKETFPHILYADPEKESPQWSVQGGITVKRTGNPKEATVEASGLVDGQPTGKHYKLRVYDDVVTRESVTTPEQITKTTEAWELSDNLGSQDGRVWMVGTRYHHCTVASTRILMEDFTHKPISEVRPGDVVVGWELRGRTRWLIRSKVLNAGCHPSQAVRRYSMDTGRSVTCTPDHKWWRGPHGGGAEYAPLGLPAGVNKRQVLKNKKLNGHQLHLSELLVPLEPAQDRASGWLAGMFDGEGTLQKNTHHPSAVIVITQSMAHPELAAEITAKLKEAAFDFREHWSDPAVDPRPTISGAAPALRKKIGRWYINGGWRGRYRFLAEIAPKRSAKIIDSLFGQLQTQRRKLVKIEDAGTADVYWLETETGNYVAEGFCSKNSDTYQAIMDRGAAKPRIYPCTDNGGLDGKPVLWSPAYMKSKLIAQGDATFSTQNLCSPLAGKSRMFDIGDLMRYEARPETLMVYILVDPARSVKKDSAHTAMVVLGLDYAGNKYLLDGRDHKMALQDRWAQMRNLYIRWRREPGIVGVRVGYERFGAIADLDYFEERMQLERLRFDITPLEWPREGPGSKVDRVQRLTPDLKLHRFYLPHPTDPERLTSLQRRMEDSGYGYRISQKIRALDEDKQLYDLTERLVMQISYFPYGDRVDLVDALSRVYDLDPTPPTPPADEHDIEPDVV